MSEILSSRSTDAVSTPFQGMPRNVQLTGDEIPQLPEGYKFSDGLLRFEPAVKRLLAEHYPDTTDAELAEWAEESRSHMRNRRQLIDVGVETTDRQLVGFGRVIHWANGGEFCDFVVHDSHRNQGIGTEIILARFRLAQKAGIAELYTGQLAETNSRRIVYEELGFCEVWGGRLVYRGDTSLGPISNESDQSIVGSPDY